MSDREKLRERHGRIERQRETRGSGTERETQRHKDKETERETERKK